MQKVLFTIMGVLLMLGETYAKWIHTSNNYDSVSINVCKDVKLHTELCHYSKNNLVSHTYFCKNGQLDNDENQWTSSVKLVKKIGDKSFWNWTGKLQKGDEQESSLALYFKNKNWNKDSYLFVPGAIYNGNKFNTMKIPYPPIVPPNQRKVNFPVTITDVPRLSSTESSIAEITSADATTPCIGFFNPKTKMGFLLFTTQNSDQGNWGYTIEESKDKKKLVFIVNSSVVREKRATGSIMKPTDDRGHHWKEGEQLNTYFTTMEFHCNTIQQFFSRYARERELISQKQTKSHITPLMIALNMGISVQNNMRWYEKGGYYKNGNGDTPYGHIQLGWVGGGMNTYPILFDGDSIGVQRSITTLKNIFSTMQGSSGFFYGIARRGEMFGDAFSNADDARDIAMIRKNGDALYFFLKQLMMLENSHKSDLIDPKWIEQTRDLADAFVVLWNRYHQLGQLVNVKTGDINLGGSTAGAIVPAALTLASEYYNNPSYSTVAQEILNSYYDEFLSNGYTTGGPGEILQCPDSESAFALLESMVLVAEKTRSKKWIDRAKDAANLCSSWMVGYNYHFPNSSIMGKAGVETCGAVWASIQNKHAAPGICSASGDCLLKLYRLTNDSLYIDMLKDIIHCQMSCMCTHYHPVASDDDGYINERINMSDWEGQGAVGYVGVGSVSWVDLTIMLASCEIPGIYVDVDQKKVFCLDQFQLKSYKFDKNKLILTVHNETPYRTPISVFVDKNRKESLPTIDMRIAKRFVCDKDRDKTIEITL